MTFDNTPLQEYYFLKEKNSFSLDPWNDRAVYFGDANFAGRISGRIERDFLEPRAVPKFFVHGFFGSGKTHTLFHIAYQLENRFRDMYPTQPVYLDIAPLRSTERWIRIHGRLMDALGLDRIRDVAEQVADSLEERDKVEGFLNAGLLRFGDEALKRSQASVFRNLLFGGRQMHLSWEWMKGRKTSLDDSQMLGTQKQLEEPQDFVHCLLNLGVLFQRGSGSRLVFLVDEAEAFRAISNPDALREARFAVRMLLDNANSYIGFIFGAQVDDPEEGGFLFESDDIRRRVGYDQGYIDLNSLLTRIEDSESFIQGTLEYLVNQEKAATAIAKENLNTTPEFFPFTEDAVRAIAAHLRDQPERAAGPSAILSYMSNGAIEAWRRRTESQIHQLVDEEIIEETIYPEESG